MATSWLKSLRAGDPDAPLEIVVRYKELLFRHAFDQLRAHVDDPQIRADEIAMTTLESACIHCQRGGFAELQSEAELESWLREATEVEVRQYLAHVQRRRKIVDAISSDQFHTVADQTTMAIDEVNDFVDGFLQTFGDLRTRKVAEKILAGGPLDEIRSQLDLTGPALRRRVDTVERAFDRAVFA